MKFVPTMTMSAQKKAIPTVKSAPVTGMMTFMAGLPIISRCRSMISSFFSAGMFSFLSMASWAFSICTRVMMGAMAT